MPTHAPEYVAALEAALHKWEPLSGQGDIRQTLAFKDGFDAAWNAALAAHPGQREPRAAGSIPRVHGVSRVHDNPCAMPVMLKAEPTDDALRAIHDSLTSQPEPRAEVTDVQWWLAELDQHGNPKLSDGAHSERAGADRAMYLIKNLGLDNKGKRWAVARVELSEPRPSADGVNHDAVSACRAMVDAARTGASS